jgi:hypothetical protein
MSVGNSLTEQLGKSSAFSGNIEFYLRSFPSFSISHEVNFSGILIKYVPDVHVAMIKVAGAMSKSTAVMKELSNLMKVPEIQKNVVEMSKGENPLKLVQVC